MTIISIFFSTFYYYCFIFMGPVNVTNWYHQSISQEGSRMEILKRGSMNHDRDIWFERRLSCTLALITLFLIVISYRIYWNSNGALLKLVAWIRTVTITATKSNRVGNTLVIRANRTVMTLSVYLDISFIAGEKWQDFIAKKSQEIK